MRFQRGASARRGTARTTTAAQRRSPSPHPVTRPAWPGLRQSRPDPPGCRSVPPPARRGPAAAILEEQQRVRHGQSWSKNSRFASSRQWLQAPKTWAGRRKKWQAKCLPPSAAGLYTTTHAFRTHPTGWSSRARQVCADRQAASRPQAANAASAALSCAVLKAFFRLAIASFASWSQRSLPSWPACPFNQCQRT